jgi:hypothetical protein
VAKEVQIVRSRSGTHPSASTPWPRLLACIVLAALLANCSREVPSGAPSTENTERRSLRQVLAEAAEDEYAPPADGKLTDEQIAMYFRVREHERVISGTARDRLGEGVETIRENEERSLRTFLRGLESFGSAADLVRTDIRAAQELGYNTAEYRWVRKRVIEAAAGIVHDELADAARAGTDRRIDDLRRRMEETGNETRRATYREIISGLEKFAGGREKEPVEEHVEHNRRLLLEYEDAVETIAVELERWDPSPGHASSRLDGLLRRLGSTSGAQIE